MKALILVIDGLADRPLRALNGRTPLEAARRENLDSLAKEAITGILDPISPGVRAGSDTSHLAIMGYDPYEVYTGRGPYEALGMGLELEPGDIAFRCNFATVDKSLVVKDRRAGRIGDTRELQRAIKEEVKLPIAFDFASLKYRASLVLKGEGLSHEVSDIDPHVAGKKVKKPMALSKAAEKTAQILWDFTQQSNKVLTKHPRNRDRELPANILLPRGGGKYLPIESFQKRYGLRASCIGTTAIIKGIARSAGFEIIEPQDDYGSRIDQALREEDKDLVLINIKEVDEAGHDNQPEEKLKIIEQIDLAVEELRGFVRENYLVILSDHSTPCTVGDHAGDTVPVLIAGPEVRADGVESFDERSCSKGGLNRLRARHIMPILLDLMNLSGKFGA